MGIIRRKNRSLPAIHASKDSSPLLPIEGLLALENLA